MPQISSQPLNPLLEISNLSCSRQEICLFSQFDLSVRSGDVILIRGPNGVGKSTLLYAMANLVEPLSGLIVRYSGFDYLGHKNGLSSLSIDNQLSQFMLMQGLLINHQPENYKISILESIGFDKDILSAKVDSLSTGQKRRLAFSRLLMGNAPLWILDEPLSGIDEEGVKMMELHIRSKAQSGGAVVLTSHQKSFHTHSISLGDYT